MRVVLHTDNTHNPSGEAVAIGPVPSVLDVNVCALCLSLVTFFCLSAVRGSPGKQINIPATDITILCKKAREVMLSQPILLELEAPVRVCGESTHAAFTHVCTRTHAQLEPSLGAN